MYLSGLVSAQFFDCDLLPLIPLCIQLYFTGHICKMLVFLFKNGIILMFLEYFTNDSLRAFELFGSMKFSHMKQQLGK